MTQNIEWIIEQKNYDHQIKIMRVWDDGSKLHYETLITFDKVHCSYDHAKAYTTTKMFKAILKACKKEHMSYNQ